jgi:hypothetical protein
MFRGAGVDGVAESLLAVLRVLLAQSVLGHESP